MSSDNQQQSKPHISQHSMYFHFQFIPNLRPSPRPDIYIYRETILLPPKTTVPTTAKDLLSLWPWTPRISSSFDLIRKQVQGRTTTITQTLFITHHRHKRRGHRERQERKTCHPNHTRNVLNSTFLEIISYSFPFLLHLH